MPIEIDNSVLPAGRLALYLHAVKAIGPLGARQARFFASRLEAQPADREDFEALLLLLLAALQRGYPRAGAGQLVESARNRVGVEARDAFQQLVGDGTEGQELFGERGQRALCEGLAGWLQGVLSGRARFRPLLGDGVDGEPGPKPLVVYDKRWETLSFQAYYLSENLLEQRLPTLLRPAGVVDTGLARASLKSALAAAFGSRPAHVRQAMAALMAIDVPFLVVSGGPGTGKSTVVNLIVRTVCAYHGLSADSVALCAPTGRAKARLLEAVTGRCAPGDPLAGIQARTIHSLLGVGGEQGARFCSTRRLPYRLVVVDEVSMVDMRLFAQLVDALPSECRLVLVGDMNQLPPVEAGAVLGDLSAGLDDSGEGTSISETHASCLAEILDGLDGISEADSLRSAVTHRNSPMVDHLVFLTRNYRSDQGILDWWQNRVAGRTTVDSGGHVEYAGPETLTGEKGLPGVAESRLLPWMRDWFDVYRELWEQKLRPALLGESTSASPSDLGALIEARRVLCCVNEGPWGRARANELLDRQFRDMKGSEGVASRWHDGQPLIVNANQPRSLDLYNGDLGIVLADEGVLYGCFAGRDTVRKVPLQRLSEIDLAYAISVHKSQGSEFDEVMLVIPDRSAMPVSRQLVYTAVTRARSRVHLLDPGGSLAHVSRLTTEERPGLLREILR